MTVITAVIMWSNNTYKSLLFLLATSQLLLLIIFWKQTFQDKEQPSKGIGRRSTSCDCPEDDSTNTERFNLEHNSTNIVIKKDLEDTKVEEVTKKQSHNAFLWETTKLKVDNNEQRPVLLVAIMSAREYKERRQAVRETWLQECYLNSAVVCKFFTDGQDSRGDPIDDETAKELEDESANNRGDLVLLNTPSGTNFSLRLLALFEWANQSQKIDYLLRIDDDHFLCLERLLAELPYRPRSRLYWGYIHCEQGMFDKKIFSTHDSLTFVSTVILLSLVSNQ